jgi:hypothetical protein
VLAKRHDASKVLTNGLEDRHKVDAFADYFADCAAPPITMRNLK